MEEIKNRLDKLYNAHRQAVLSGKPSSNVRREIVETELELFTRYFSSGDVLRMNILAAFMEVHIEVLKQNGCYVEGIVRKIKENSVSLVRVEKNDESEV